MSELSTSVYRDLRFLVVDDQAAARQSLRICAQNMGSVAVEFSVGYHDAIRRIRARMPDIILCDYDLGDGRTGQQLLEELRRLSMLPEETIFMMVTAEQSYEQVVAAVEFVPDDYIIKPFSSDRLQFRLDRVLQRKRFFQPLFRAKKSGDYARAESFIEKHLKSEAGQPYRFELLRQKAELALAKGDSLAAQAAYAEILALYPFPWAKAGMAKALHAQNRLNEAREIVDDVVNTSPMYFDAFDLKARICIDMGDYEEAQKTVTETSQRTSRNYLRKRLLADAALLNGDAATARATMADIVQNDLTPGAVNMADRLMLVRSHLEAGDLLAAEQSIDAIPEKSLRTASLDDNASYQAMRALMSPESEKERFTSLCEVWLPMPLSTTARVDIVRAAFAIGNPELALATTTGLFTSDEIRRVFKLVRGIFNSHGMVAEFRELQKQAALEKIAAEGVRK
jgi:DNA-binding response OmpR family regulator